MIAAAVEEVLLHGLARHAARFSSSEPYVAIYEFDCRQPATVLAPLQAVLDAGELEHIGRLRQPPQRQRSIVVRGVLRWVLGAHLQMRPESVPLQREPGDRPRLRPAPGVRDLSISSASSGTSGVVAIGAGAEIGIDVEHVTRQRFPDGVSKTMLHPRETAVFETLPRGARAAWLADAWVCKEATLKALGVGLEVDPRTVEVMSLVATIRPDVSDFRLARYLHLSGWLYRSDATATALVASAPGVRPCRSHLAL